MAKAEISWTRVTDEGEKVQAYAQKVGDRWKFFLRSRRFDQWQAVPNPILEDWLLLLDGVRRRAARRLQRPEEVQRVEKAIRERFPEAAL